MNKRTARLIGLVGTAIVLVALFALLLPSRVVVTPSGRVSLTNRVAFAAIESLAPDALLRQDNLTGTLADIDEDPDGPDGLWLTRITNNVDTVCRVGFPTPTGNPTIGVDLQNFKIWVRQQPDGAGADPTVAVSLYENGILVAEIMTATAVPSATGQLFTATWDASLLGTADGSLVECYIYGTAVGGAPSNRCTVEVGAVEWNVDYSVCSPNISNTPTSKGFGVVAESSSYWSMGSAPTFPLDDAECFFTVTNNSGGSIDINVKAINFVGGVGWTLAGSVGENIVVLKVGKSGDTLEGNMITLTTIDQLFMDSLADTASKKWEAKLETGTFTDGAEKSSTITLTAVCE